MNYKKKNISFTLIELLVVIVIIGILAGVVMISTSSSINKANFAKAKAFSSNIQNSMLLNLVSEWTFDEPEVSNKTKDSWGVNDGTVNGATYDDGSSGECVSGGCYYFDGNDDYINCYNSQSLKSLSLSKHNSSWSIWFKSSDDWGELIGKYQPFQFIKNSNGLASYIYNGSAHIIGSPYQGNLAIGGNDWHYAVYIVDRNGYFNTYLDGIQDTNKVNISSHSLEDWAQINNLYIGCRDPGSQHYAGFIDDVRIYNETLSLSQINQNYIAGLNSMLANGNISREEYNERIKLLGTK